MLFDLPHILYMIISVVVTASILVVAKFFIKKQKSKDLFLRIWAVLTVVIHFSSIYFDYYIGKIENPQLGLSLFIPAYACNVCMWLLMIVAFAKKRGTFINLLSQFVAFGGIVCGIIGILVNENYGGFAANHGGAHPMTNFEVVKGLLSHSTMLVGSLYLLVGGYVKARVKKTTLGVTVGLSILFVDGLLVNGLNRIFNMPDVNSMYLHGVPFDNMPWINTLTIGIAGVLVAFVVGMIAERITLPKEQRWYYRARSVIEAEEVTDAEEMEEVK